MSEMPPERKLPTLTYETKDGEKVEVEADFIVVRGGSDVKQDHIVVTQAKAWVDGSDLEASACRIAASGCYVLPLDREGAGPNYGSLDDARPIMPNLFVRGDPVGRSSSAGSKVGLLSDVPLSERLLVRWEQMLDRWIRAFRASWMYWPGRRRR